MFLREVWSSSPHGKEAIDLCGLSQAKRGNLLLESGKPYVSRKDS